MKRREFITLLGGAAAWPLQVRAQQPAMPVIGFLNSQSPDVWASRLRAFHQGLNETGFVEGRNVAVEYRWAEGKNDRIPGLAADLVHRQVSVIAATGTTEALTAKAATTAIPIVFTIAADPVSAGLVAGLNRPGANLTGVTVLAVEVGPKKLELLRELVPRATAIALLVNPTNSNAEAQSRDLQVVARTLGLELPVVRAGTERELNSVFAHLAEQRIGGLVIGTDPFFTSRSELLAALSLRHAIPTIFQYREFVAAGGLMSYGGSFTAGYYLVGVYTGRVLKGEKPSDLPVQRYTRVDLIINLKTAKTLGITFPITLLGRADEVIE